MFEYLKIPQDDVTAYTFNTQFGEISTTGWCCRLDGSGDFAFPVTKSQCFSSGGYWLPPEANPEGITGCPKQIKKHCCRTVSGSPVLTTNITECNCLKLTGNPIWVETTITTAEECPESAGLVSGGACCYWDYNGTQYVSKCASANDADACSALHDGATEGLRYTFYPGQNCYGDDGNIICSGTRRWTAEEKEQLGADCVQDTDLECGQKENILGNCCTKLESGNVLCNITTKANCSGFWNYLGAVTPCTSGSLCSGVYFQNIISNKSYPPTASYSTLISSTNTLESLPNVLQPYQGGIYAGIFEPGVSTIYGNKNTGIAQTYKSYRTGNGGLEKKWIIIIAPEDIEVDRFVMGSDETSSYDGFYNLNKLDIPNITGININGFTDWYIPSKQELEYIFNTVPYDYSGSGFSKLDKEYYLTSTFYNVSSNNTKLNNLKLVYAQINLKEKYGETFISPQQTIKQNIRLIRRIYLGT